MDWAVEWVTGTCQEHGSLEVKSSLRTAPSFAMVHDGHCVPEYYDHNCLNGNANVWFTLLRSGFLRLIRPTWESASPDALPVYA